MDLITSLGPKSKSELGLILPHEHIFVDLRTWNQIGYAQADTNDVIYLMAPQIEKARQAGVTAIVECSPIGVGRRADILKAVSLKSNFPLVVPTGIYREPWIPDWVHSSSEDDLTAWMLSELTGQIEQTGVQAGWIKLSAGDNGLTITETKVLKAALRAARTTNSVIGSHTIQGKVVREQLNIINELEYPPERFIWIHANVEEDFEINLEMARHGMWISYDGIGSDSIPDELFINRIQRLLEAGMGDRILLSHDRGWFDPAQPGGGIPRTYTYLIEIFIPKLLAAGVDEQTIHHLTVDNPFNAFAR